MGHCRTDQNRFFPPTIDQGRTAMNISQKLLDILCCPETNDDLHLLSKEERERVNRAIAHGTAMNRKNEAVLQPIDEGLLRADGKFLYPIQDGIPIMLIDEAIDMRTVP